MPQEDSYAPQQELMTMLAAEAWNKYILENKELLENLSHLLKGEFQTPREKEIDGEKVIVMVWEKPENQEPPINDNGYYFTMLHITQALDKTQASGNLREEQAMESINQLMKALTNVFTIKYKDFGLRSQAEAKTVLVSMMNLLKTHLSKSIDMALIKQLASSYSISEQRFSPLPKGHEAGLTM